MHQLVLITAMATTTGLFGGGKHCGKSHHGGRKAVVSSCYSASPCGGSATYAAPQAPMAQGSPASPQAAPAALPSPGTMVPPAPTAPPTAPPAPQASTAVPTGTPVVATGDLR